MNVGKSKECIPSPNPMCMHPEEYTYCDVCRVCDVCSMKKLNEQFIVCKREYKYHLMEMITWNIYLKYQQTKRNNYEIPKTVRTVNYIKIWTSLNRELHKREYVKNPESFQTHSIGSQ